MNELIRQLAELAGMIIGDTSEFDMAKIMPKELKFAQLIVEECIAKISQEQDLAEQNWLCDNGVHICHELTKHFGIE